MATKNRKKGGITRADANSDTNASMGTSADGSDNGSGDSNSQGGTAPDATSPDTATQQGGAPAQLSIHKGVYLSALIFVEGDEQPSADFNNIAISALKTNLSQFFTQPHDGLTMTLKNVNVENNVEEASKAKFQF